MPRLEVRFGQRAGGVEFHGDVVNQAFVVANKIRRAALADGFDNIGRDAEFESVGRVDEPGILRGGRGERIPGSSTAPSGVRAVTREANRSWSLSVDSASSGIAQPDRERAAHPAAHPFYLVVSASLIGSEF